MTYISILVFADSVSIDYGTAIPVVTPDETTILYTTTAKSWRGSWRSDTQDVIQGVYSDSGYSSSHNWHRGCMWFGNLFNVLSGMTVKSAMLTLHRNMGRPIALRSMCLNAPPQEYAEGVDIANLCSNARLLEPVCHRGLHGRAVPHPSTCRPPPPAAAASPAHWAGLLLR